MPDQIPASGIAAPPQETTRFTVFPGQIAQARAAGYSDQEIVDHLTPRAPEQFAAAAQAGYSPTEVLDHLASRTLFDVNGARKAGYSDAEIVQHLQTDPKALAAGFDLGGALKAGYSPTEILDHLAPQPSGLMANAQQGTADVLGGVGKTLETYAGKSSLSDWLQRQAKNVAPDNFVPTPVYDQRGFHPSGILPALARGVPATVGGITAAGAAAALAPEAGVAAIAAPILGAAGFGTLANAGNEAAATGSKTRGALTAGAESLLGALPVSRFLPGAGTISQTGLKGAAGVVKNLGKTAAEQAAASAAADATGQIARTGTIDPDEVKASAITGAATGAVYGARPAARAALDAAKFRNITPEFATAATQVANRMQNYTDGQPIKDGGAEVFTKAQNDIRGELGDAISDLRSRVDLPRNAANILNNALSGQQPTKGDYNVLQRAVAGDPQADNVINLLRQNHVADMVAATGDISNGKFTGGLAQSVGHKLSGENLLKTALIASGVEGTHLIGFSPETLAAVGAGYAGLNALDKFTGANEPGVRFMRKFGDGGQTPVRLAAPQPQPQAPAAPQVSPTGPKIPLAPSPWGNAPTPVAAPPAVAGGSIITPQVRAQMNAMASLQKLRPPQAVPQPPQPAIDPLALPKSITAPAAAIARGAALAQKLQQRGQAPVNAPEPAVNPLALPKSITGPAANIMRGAALTQKLQQQSNAAQAAQAPQSAPPAGPITKANGATTEGPYKLPVAPYAGLPVNEAAQRILGDVRAANVPVKNATAFLTKTMALLNTVRDKVQAVTQAAASIPPADVARFEGVRSQKAAIDYREHLKREYPAAAAALDKVFSDDAIARQWAQKK